MNFIIPILVCFIIVYSYFKKVDIYNTFLRGAKEGIDTLFSIAPAVIGMVFAITLFIKSDVISILLFPFNSVLNNLGIPKEVISMALIRPISGNASLSFMSNIYLKYGVDSYYGYLASVIQGCTDTTIYVLALYFGSIKVTNSKYALPVGLFADFFGIMASFILTKVFFS